MEGKVESPSQQTGIVMKRPLKVLLSNSTDIFAGGEDYVLILARRLRMRGHRVWVSALPGHLLLTKCEQAGIFTLPLDYRGMSHVFSVARELRRHLRTLSIDIIHSNANYDRTCAGFATAFSTTRHVAGIHSTHSIQHNITHWWRNRWGTDHFITDADAGRNVLINEDGITPERITTVPIGIENESPEYNARARATIRAQWGVPDSTVVIGNVARLVPFKGHAVLLNAVAHVVRESSEVLFPIAGDGELLETLRTQVRTLHIKHAVRFLGFRNNLEEIYPGFDIYCHSSLELAAEMFPIAILRALGTGLPVVCTNVGGIAAMVREGKSGFLVPPEDPRALADALLRVIRNPALRATMGEESLGLFQERYHAPVMAARIEEVYSRLLNREDPVP
jgi:glycosyltransferase involved in cell wall biosynthesis